MDFLKKNKNKINSNLYPFFLYITSFLDISSTDRSTSYNDILYNKIEKGKDSYLTSPFIAEELM